MWPSYNSSSESFAWHAIRRAPYAQLFSQHSHFPAATILPSGAGFKLYLLTLFILLTNTQSPQDLISLALSLSSPGHLGRSAAQRRNFLYLADARVVTRG